ncbi:unnamed protein product, partial [Mesorhabditis spiculigera]
MDGFLASPEDLTEEECLELFYLITGGMLKRAAQPAGVHYYAFNYPACLLGILTPGTEAPKRAYTTLLTRFIELHVLPPAAISLLFYKNFSESLESGFRALRNLLNKKLAACRVRGQPCDIQTDGLCRLRDAQAHMQACKNLRNDLMKEASNFWNRPLALPAGVLQPNIPEELQLPQSLLFVYGNAAPSDRAFFKRDPFPPNAIEASLADPPVEAMSVSADESDQDMNEGEAPVELEQATRSPNQQDDLVDATGALTMEDDDKDFLVLPHPHFAEFFGELARLTSIKIRTVDTEHDGRRWRRLLVDGIPKDVLFGLGISTEAEGIRFADERAWADLYCAFARLRIIPREITGLVQESKDWMKVIARAVAPLFSQLMWRLLLCTLVFFPLLLVCGLILVYGLWTEHPNILISYMVLVAGLLVARMVTVTRVLITLFDPKSNWSLEPTYRAFGVADEKGETVTSYALFHLGYAIFFIVVYVLFIYIVDKCRRYFIRLDEFKETQAHNLTYKH